MNLLLKTRLLKIVIVFASLLSVTFFIALYAPSRMSTEFDDSYMYCRYASNYLAGNGFSWNTSEGAAYGATSPAYLFLITFLKSLFQTENSLLLSLTSCSAGLTGLLLLIGAGYLSGGEGQLAKLHLPRLVIPLCLLSSSFRYHCFTGMETTLAFASNSFLVLSVVFYRRNSNLRAYTILLLASVFTFMVRPDNGVYAVLFPVLFLLSVNKFTPGQAAIFLLAFCAGVGLLLLLYLNQFGSALPIPFYSKTGDFFKGYAGLRNWNAAEYLLLFLRDVSPFAAVAILFSGKHSLKPLLAIILPVVITFFFFSGSVQIMGWFARYYFPAIPFLVFTAFIAGESYIKHGHSFTCRHALIRISLCILVLFPALYLPAKLVIADWWRAALPSIQLYSPETEYRSSSGEVLETLPWWAAVQYMSDIVGKLPSGIKIAATEYGYIASENLNAVIIDMAGLHDRELVEHGFTSEKILSRLPDMIWMPHTDYTFFRKELLDDPIFQADYEYYPGVFNYGIAVRRNSDSYAEIIASLGSTFSEAYPGSVLSDYLGLPIN